MSSKLLPALSHKLGLMEYKEQYQHPDWQKKRLEILNRDDFTCVSCGDTDKQLHVHHIEYIKGRLVWDYPNNNFSTQCTDCHNLIHYLKERSYKLVAQSTDKAEHIMFMCKVQSLIFEITNRDDSHKVLDFMHNITGINTDDLRNKILSDE